METKPENVEETPRQTTTGPGERLQAARIKKGLSVDDIASRMHLSTAILEAIEENNFEEITAPIFVKGYLRAYARIVALDEDEMIRQYSEFYSEEDPPISSTSNMSPELSSSDTGVKWTTYLVILVLGLLLGAWWWNKQQNETPPISLDATQPETAEVQAEVQVSNETDDPEETLSAEQEAAPAVAEAEPIEAPVEVEESQQPAQAESEPASTEVDVAILTLAEDGSSSDEVTEAAPEEAPSSADTEQEEQASNLPSDTDTVVADETVQPAAEAAQPGTQSQPTRTAPVGTDQLRIIVNADTWADVKDANNHQLEYNLLRADTVVDLTGQAPFTVFLGNGYGVEILFNDSEISIESRIRDDNTARITVGG